MTPGKLHILCILLVVNIEEGSVSLQVHPMIRTVLCHPVVAQRAKAPVIGYILVFYFYLSVLAAILIEGRENIRRKSQRRDGEGDHHHVYFIYL